MSDSTTDYSMNIENRLLMPWMLVIEALWTQHITSCVSSKSSILLR